MAFDLDTGFSWGTNPFKDNASDPSMAFMGTLAEDVLTGNSLGGGSFDFSSVTSPPNTMDRSDPRGDFNGFVPWAPDSTLGEDSVSSGSDNSLLQFPRNQMNLPEIDLDKFFDDPFPDIDLDQPVPDYSSTAAFIDPWRASTPTAQLDCSYRLIGRNQINFSPKSSVIAPPKNELDGINYFSQNTSSSISPATWNSICISPASLNAPSLTEIATPTQPNSLFHSPTNPNRLTPSPPSPQTPTNPRATKVAKKSAAKPSRSRKDRKKPANSRKRSQSPLSASESLDKAKIVPDHSRRELESPVPAGVKDLSCEAGLGGHSWPSGVGQSTTPSSSSLHTLHPAFQSGLLPNPFDFNGSTPSGNSNFSSSPIHNNSLSPNYAPFGTPFGLSQDGRLQGFSENFFSTVLDPSLHSNPFSNPPLMSASSIWNSYDPSKSESPAVLMAQSRSDPETYQQTEKGIDTFKLVQDSVSFPSLSTPTSSHNSPMRPGDRAACSLAGLQDTISPESFTGFQSQLNGSTTTAGLFNPVSPRRFTSSHLTPSQQRQPGVADQSGQAGRSPSPSRVSTTPATSPSRCKSSASVFVNFTPKDSKKLLSGVAPSGSSKRKRPQSSTPCTPSKHRVVTT